MSSTAIVLDVPRYEQPDDTACGPTCLAQIYHYYGVEKPLAELVEGVGTNPDGGTLGVYLGLRALEDGWAALAYSYNLRVFDPTWFDIDRQKMIEKLRARQTAVQSDKLKRALEGYARFLELGGEIRFEELTPELIARFLTEDKPVLTGLSATYLYGTAREYEDEYDDLRGYPAGHFVVICGYDAAEGRFLVCDPSPHVPFAESGRYSVGAHRLISSILLGDLTYDAVLLVLSPA